MSVIAYVCADPGVPLFGSKGASVHVREVVRAFRRLGHEVILLAARPGGDPPPDLAGVDVVSLPQPRGEPAARERAARSGNAALARALDRLPRVDVVYERYSLWSTAGMAWARAAAVPGVLEVNAPLVEEQARHRDLHDRAAAQRHARTAITAAGRVVAVSRPVGRWARRHGARDLRVVPNGVDPQRFAVAAARTDRCRRDTYTVGFLGTLKPWHGVEVLGKAFCSLAAKDPRVLLRVVGDGPLRAGLEARVAAAGFADRTQLTGALDPDEVPTQLHAMDIAVAPYPAGDDAYFSPLKILEYLAGGVPVVASRVGQVPTLLDHGRAGILSRPGDPDDIVAAVQRLRDEPAMADALAARGTALVAARHTWDQVVVASLDGLPVPEGVVRAVP